MQAQRLNHRISRLEIIRQIFIIIGVNSLPARLSATTSSIHSCTSSAVTSSYFSSMASMISPCVYSRIMPITSYARSSTLWMEHCRCQHDVVTIQFILMYHFFYLITLLKSITFKKGLFATAPFRFCLMFDLRLLFFARLVCYAAGCFASGLARCLHSPQPPFCTDLFKSRVAIVLILLIFSTSLKVKKFLSAISS